MDLCRIALRARARLKIEAWRSRELRLASSSPFVTYFFFVVPLSAGRNRTDTEVRDNEMTIIEKRCPRKKIFLV